jgi:archaellum component FlaC
MPKKSITTIEGLARMINEGFKTTASKEDIQRVEVRLDSVESRLGRIENLLIAEQKREIEDLKVRMKRLEDALAVSYEVQRSEPPLPGGFCLFALAAHLSAWVFCP